jgi:hypothetical protein
MKRVCIIVVVIAVVANAGGPAPPGGCDGSVLKRELKSFLSDKVL